jgi:3-hydroxybutyryl-CoA dehydrogenase
MKLGIVGYGRMGRNIFTLFGQTPAAVTVLGRDPSEMARQNARIEKRLARDAGNGPSTGSGQAARPGERRFTTCWEDLRDCDLLVEAVDEDFATKVEVLRRAEETLPPHAVLTTNTSCLSIARLGESLRDPRRFCGFHFFHPVQLTRVVEIITGPGTAPQVVDLLRQTSSDLGRTPLVVRDRAGSCINVVLAHHTCEALYVLEQGLASPSLIDAVAGRFARVGPCEFVDVVSLPLFGKVLGRCVETFGSPPLLPDLTHRLICDGRLGRYANQGIYLYHDDRATDGGREYYLNPLQTHSRTGMAADVEHLHRRLLFSIYLGILHVVQAGLARADDLSLGVRDVLGLTTDPLEEMRALGHDGLRQGLARLRDEVGPRFDPGPVEGAVASLAG